MTIACSSAPAPWPGSTCRFNGMVRTLTNVMNLGSSRNTLIPAPFGRRSYAPERGDRRCPSAGSRPAAAGARIRRVRWTTSLFSFVLTPSESQRFRKFSFQHSAVSSQRRPTRNFACWCFWYLRRKPFRRAGVVALRAACAAGPLRAADHARQAIVRIAAPAGQSMGWAMAIVARRMYQYAVW
jgi:hypothetical protein